MGNSAKEKRQYIIINVLLILIVLLLGVYIYKVIQSNKQQIKVGYEQGVNVVQQLQDEYINVEKVETTENQNTMVVPIDDNYKNSKEYDFAYVKNNKYYYVIPWKYIEPLWQGEDTELMVIKNTRIYPLPRVFFVLI